MGYVHRYTEVEVSRILKDSEGSATDGGRSTGHAEGLHELQAVGRSRASTSEAALSDRAVEEPARVKLVVASVTQPTAE